MKLGKIVNEGQVNGQYVERFHKYLIKKYKGKDFNGWKLLFDNMSGTFYWTNSKSKNVIMATPFWEYNDELPIDVIDDDSGDEVLSIKLPLKSTGDYSKDEINYLKLLKSVFQKIK